MFCFAAAAGSPLSAPFITRFLVHAMSASEAVRAACGLQWTVRIAAGFGLSPGHREAAMDRALVLGCRLLLHLPRACGTDTDSRILLVGRLSVSSGPVYAPAPVCSWSAPCHLERLMLICCSLPDDLGEVSRRRLCNPRHPGLSTWFTGLSAVAPAPTTLLCQQACCTRQSHF